MILRIEVVLYKEWIDRKGPGGGRRWDRMRGRLTEGRSIDQMFLGLRPRT